MGKPIRFDDDDREWEASVEDVRREIPICEATGKKSWRSYGKAANVATMQSKRDQTRIVAYRCDSCGMYHVGHVIGNAQLRNDAVNMMNQRKKKK